MPHQRPDCLPRGLSHKSKVSNRLEIALVMHRPPTTIEQHYIKAQIEKKRWTLHFIIANDYKCCEQVS